MLKAIQSHDSAMNNAIERGVGLKQVSLLPLRSEIARMKELGSAGEIQALAERIKTSIDALEAER